MNSSDPSDEDVYNTYTYILSFTSRGLKARVFMLLTWRQVLTEAMAEAIAQKAQEREEGQKGPSKKGSTTHRNLHTFKNNIKNK